MKCPGCRTHSLQLLPEDEITDPGSANGPGGAVEKKIGYWYCDCCGKINTRELLW